MIRMAAICALLSVFLAYGTTALAQGNAAKSDTVFGALAVSEDGKHWAWANRPTQAQADKHVLTECNKSAPNKDCALQAFKAAARATGGGRVGFDYSKISVSDARAKAIKSCGTPECKVDFETTDPGFISLAHPDAGGTFYVHYGASNSDASDRAAIAMCEKNSAGKCSLKSSSLIAGAIKQDASPPPTRTQSPTTNEDCRPKTARLECQSQCTNGDCIVTYENGCRRRVQVRPVFDPFSKQWNYPSPSC